MEMNLEERIAQINQRLVLLDVVKGQEQLGVEVKQLLRDFCEEVKPDRYMFKHEHDIQDPGGGYLCMQCEKPLDEIVGHDGLGKCPHFRSWNKAIDDMEYKIKELGL